MKSVLFVWAVVGSHPLSLLALSEKISQKNLKYVNEKDTQKKSAILYTATEGISGTLYHFVHDISNNTA